MQLRQALQLALQQPYSSRTLWAATSLHFDVLSTGLAGLSMVCNKSNP